VLVPDPSLYLLSKNKPTGSTTNKEVTGSGTTVSLVVTDASSKEKYPVSFLKPNSRMLLLELAVLEKLYCVKPLLGTPTWLYSVAPPNEAVKELTYGAGVAGDCASQKLIV